MLMEKTIRDISDDYIIIIQMTSGKYFDKGERYLNPKMLVILARKPPAKL
jgi:hypothetical protein